ncbi:hypothetical protein BsWGS_00790 [Bradybaena similaris]
MEDQRSNFASTFILVCYLGSALGENRCDLSCNSSPFVTSRSQDSFLAKETTPSTGACEVESDKLSGLVCLPDAAVLTAHWKSNDFMLPQQKSPDATQGNKSKVTSHSKMAIKKHNSTKKLKGSKSQRKKKKKKKMGKKKKTR